MGVYWDPQGAPALTRDAANLSHRRHPFESRRLDLPHALACHFKAVADLACARPP
jgi:hypothetical protein